ncbi:MAG: hypothetical protein M1834_003572 [Cirrosporium novae-zelandiae]|nr:MAG: hypothetical protein M1834_003572 [Cirrosporium novae-zelandiae]
MASSRILNLLSIIVFLGTISFPCSIALRVASGSSCTEDCTSWNNGSSTTELSELLCYDSEYNTTTKGKRFQSCINCELSSTYVDTSTGATDLAWAMYNLRATFDKCVFGYPNTSASVSTPCLVSCADIEEQMELAIINPEPAAPFDYCTNGTFLDEVSQCAFCYSLMDDQKLFAKYLNVLQLGCEEEPASGTLLSGCTNPFYGNATVTSSGSITLSTSGTNSGSSSGNFPLSAKIALGFGVPFVFTLCMVGLAICIMKRRKAALARQRNFSWAGHVSAIQSPRSPFSPYTPYSGFPGSPGMQSHYGDLPRYTDGSPISPVQKAFNPKAPATTESTMEMEMEAGIQKQQYEHEQYRHYQQQQQQQLYDQQLQHQHQQYENPHLPEFSHLAPSTSPSPPQGPHISINPEITSTSTPPPQPSQQQHSRSDSLKLNTQDLHSSSSKHGHELETPTPGHDKKVSPVSFS